jgi:HD domain
MNGLLGEIGTIEWGRRTNGILGRGERGRFIAAVVLTTARALPRLLASRAGFRGSGPDPSRLTPPDTSFAREVVEACVELEPTVVEHSYRSYIFARALGEVEGVECDEEALFAATMLHDISFPTMGSLSDRCFAVAGAETAAQVLDGSPLPDATRHDVLDAITLHLNPAVPRERGAIQHLAHDGILLDVLGLRGWELDHAGIRRTFELHPRLGFTVRGEALLRAHGRRVHGCRAGALFSAGFGPALKTGPWRALDRAD